MTTPSTASAMRLGARATVPGRRPLTAALAALLLSGGCAASAYARMERPAGNAALGLSFGAPREAAEGALRAAGVPFTPAPGDPDAILATRCPVAPAAVPCRLVFGPTGLYAAQLEAPAEDAGRLRSAVEDGLGRPTRRGEEDAQPEGGASALVAAWERDGWTVAVSRAASQGGAPAAVLRVERDAVAPPVVAGVPLGRRRGEVEPLLAQQGAALVHRDAEATTWLGCPQGDGAALTCVVSWVGDRAASVTEVHPTPADDREALAAWRALTARLAGEIGWQPTVSECPRGGPERATGDCTATWGTERLVIVVGAHRNAGGEHRGVISVYTAWSWPPLAREGAGAPEE